MEATGVKQGSPKYLKRQSLTDQQMEEYSTTKGLIQLILFILLVIFFTLIFIDRDNGFAFIKSLF